MTLSNVVNAIYYNQSAWGAIKDDDVDIDMDINRNGTVENAGPDEDDELSQGSIVIRDHDDVYSDPDEPARHREVRVRSSNGGNVLVSRSSANTLKLYDAATEGAELFGGANEISLQPGTYWLQGGSQASTAVRSDWLKARKDEDGSQTADQINITVIWVEISARVTGNLRENPLFDGYEDYNERFGDALGVRSDPRTDVIAAMGHIEIEGSILPADLSQTSFSPTITEGFVEPKKDRDEGASAEFGFVFRRHAEMKSYSNGLSAFENIAGNDDSFRDFQDPMPDLDNGKSIIIDVDAPTVSLGGDNKFMHLRANLIEHVVFNFLAHTPERASRKMEWFTSLDVGKDYQGDAVFVVDPQGNGDAGKRNEVGFDAHLPSLELELALPQLTAIPNMGDFVISKTGENSITITGVNLVGKFYLKNAQGFIIKPDYVAVKEGVVGSEFSNATEARIRFSGLDPDAPVGAGWTLYVENVAGVSNGIAGFSVVA